MKKWAESFPDHYQPYLAAAEHYYAQAWKSRGHNWAKETSERKIQEMQSFLAKAESNTVAALKINDKTAVAYDVLIGIATLNGDEESKDKIIKKLQSCFHTHF